LILEAEMLLEWRVFRKVIHSNGRAGKQTARPMVLAPAKKNSRPLNLAAAAYTSSADFADGEGFQHR